jgi:adhesin transport system outer membrane protein
VAAGLAALAPGAGGPVGASAQATTLEEAVQQAVLKNPDVGAAAGDKRAADEQISQARAGLFPQADLRGTIGPEWANTPSTRAGSRPGQDDSTFFLGRTDQTFTLRQMLFDGFETLSNVDRRKQLSDSAAAQVMQTSEQTGLDAIETYLDVRRFADIVQINRENVRTHESYVAALQRRMDLGAGDVSDLRRAQSRLAAARNALAQSEGQHKDAQSRYQRVVGDPPVNLKPPAPPEAAVPPDDEAGIALAQKTNPRVVRALSETEAARANLRAVRASFFPQLDLELNGQTGDNLRGIRGRDSSANALLVLRYALSRGGQDLARTQEAVERLSAANERLVAARQDAERDMRLAMSALRTARERLAAANEQVASDARGRDAFRRLFDVGRSRILDLLDSERDYYNSLSQRVSQEATAVFGVYRVLQSGGVLLRTLKVRPRDEAFGEDETPWAAEVAAAPDARAAVEPPVFEQLRGVAPPPTPDDPAIVPHARAASPSATMWLRSRRGGGYIGPTNIPPIDDTPEAAVATWPQKIDDLPPLSDVRPQVPASRFGTTQTPPAPKTPWPDTVRPPPLGDTARAPAPLPMPGAQSDWPSYVPVPPLDGGTREAPPLDPAKAQLPAPDPKAWRYGVPLPPIGDEPPAKAAAKPRRLPAVEAAEAKAAARAAAEAAAVAPAAGRSAPPNPPPVYERGAWRYGVALPPLGDPRGDPAPVRPRASSAPQAADPASATAAEPAAAPPVAPLAAQEEQEE